MKLNRNIILAIVFSGVVGTILGRFTAPSKSLTSSLERNRGKEEQAHKSSQTRSILAGSDANNLKANLFKNISPSEFEDLAIAALESKDEVNSNALLHVIFSEWAKNDPEQALLFAGEHNRTDLLYEGLKEFGKVDADTALKWIAENIKDVTAHGEFTAAVFRGLVAVDPALAVSQAENFQNGPQRDRLLFMTIDEWSKHDIESVFDWLEEREVTPLISGIHEQVIGRYIDASPQKASELIANMPDGEGKANYASRLAFQLASEDIQSALSWTESMEGSAKNFALMGLVEQWASGEGGIQALDYVTNSASGGNRDELMNMAAMKLSQSDPEGLEKSLANMNENDQLIAASHLAQVYSIAMPDKSDEWLASLEAGPVRDIAIESSLNAYRHTNISKAFELSESISDDSTRAREIQQVMLEWIPINQRAAVEELQASSSISEREKEEMLEQIYNRVEIREHLLPSK